MCVLTTAAAAPAPSEAQLRIRDSATNTMILQGEQPQRGGAHQDRGGWGEADESFCSNTSFPPDFFSLRRLLRSWWKQTEGGETTTLIPADVAYQLRPVGTKEPPVKGPARGQKPRILSRFSSLLDIRGRCNWPKTPPMDTRRLKSIWVLNSLLRPSGKHQ